MPFGRPAEIIFTAHLAVNLIQYEWPGPVSLLMGSYWRQVILGQLGLGLLFATLPILAQPNQSRKRAANSNFVSILGRLFVFLLGLEMRATAGRP